MKKFFGLVALCAMLFGLASCQNEPGSAGNYIKLNGKRYSIKTVHYGLSEDGARMEGVLTDLTEEQFKVADETGVVSFPFTTMTFGYNVNGAAFWVAGYHCTGFCEDETKGVLGFRGILGDIYAYDGVTEKPWTFQDSILTFNVDNMKVKYCRRDSKEHIGDTTTAKISIHYKGRVTPW